MLSFSGYTQACETYRGKAIANTWQPHFINCSNHEPLAQPFWAHAPAVWYQTVILLFNLAMYCVDEPVLQYINGVFLYVSHDLTPQ